MSMQPSSSGRWAPFISPHRAWPSVASHRSGSSRSRNSRNWRTRHVGASRSTYWTRSRPTCPVAVHASFSQRSAQVLGVLAVPRRPAHVVAVGGERAPSGHGSQSAVAIEARYGGHVIDLEDAQRLVLEACPPLAPVDRRSRRGNRARAGRRRRRRRGRPAVRQLRRRRLRRARRRPRRRRPSSCTVVGEVAAGAAPFDGVVGAGEAVRIMTGAPLPAGADAVAMVEDSERLDGDRVRLSRAGARRGRRARRRRRRRSAGDLVFAGRHGRRARPSPACSPASTPAGSRSSRPPVSPCCRPATSWSTDGSPLRPGQIRESNATMLAPLLAEAGCVVDRPRRRPRRRGRARGRAARRGGDERRHRHERRRQHGRLRRRQGRARAHRRHAVDAGRDQAGQAVRLRRCSTARRSSGCPATRSARWSASSCSPARRCGG